MADDWSAFSPQPAAAQGGDDWSAFQPQATAPAPEPAPSANDALPEAYLARVGQGKALADLVNKDGQRGIIDKLFGLTGERYQLWPEAAARSGFTLAHDVMVGNLPVNVIDQETGEVKTNPELVRRSMDMAMFQLGQTHIAPSAPSAAPLIDVGGGRMARAGVDANGALTAEVVGHAPTDQDFTAAAKALGAKEEVLRQKWQQEGIHPAEAVHDARRDAFAKHELTAKQTPAGKLPDEEAEFMGVPADLGAAVNTDPPFVPLDQQPASPPGSLVARGRAAIDQALGLAKNVQYLLDPMATGSDRAMVIAKDAVNSVRRIRWDHMRIDQDILARFDEESQRRMWNAMDEESVSRQLGEPESFREHQGLATLNPEERAAVDELQARSQAAWLHAVDAGLVEGEGLPAYTPRMVMNVAAAGENLAPRALNELGRNVFTRTSQMLQRKYMTAEETEAAAKSLVAKRMAERGAGVDEINAALEKVQIARNVRALPLATARLEEAAVWKEMINKVEDTGKASGQDTVAVGHKPDSSWFTIAGNPAFTRWEPALERNPATGKWGVRTDDSGRPLMVPKPIYMAPEFRGPMTAILDENVNRGKVVESAQSLYGALMALKGKAMTAILNSPLIHNEVVWSKAMEAAGGREWLGFRLYSRGNRIVNGSTGRAQELIERGLNPLGPRGDIQDITAMMEQPTLLPGRSITAKVLGFVPGLFDEGAERAVRSAIDKAGDFWHNTLLWDRIRDLHFGLADHLSDTLVAKGVDRLLADRVATHFSNIIVGSIPKEAMSNAARATANMMLFSRSFTLGNLATYKQAAFGLPKPILAQIERDFLNFKPNPETGVYEPPAGAEDIQKLAQGMARRKAISTIVLSAGLYYVGNALIQHAVNVAVRNQSMDDQLQGYARRYKDAMEKIGRDPWEIRHLVQMLSPTADNEPSKQDRAYIGNTADGTGLYARNPTGKFGEELVGYPTKPMTMIKQKLSPLAGGLLDILENDKGFGRKIYNERDTTMAGNIQNAINVGKYLVEKHLPDQQLGALWDTIQGQGDQKLNTLRLVGPMLGFTVSQGAPLGPAHGEQLSAKEDFEARFGLAWPDIKQQIKRGDLEGARRAMTAIRVPPWMQKSLERSATSKSWDLRGRTLKNFLETATPEQINRMNRAR